MFNSRSRLFMLLAAIALAYISPAKADYPDKQITIAEGPAAFMKRVPREVPVYKEVIDKTGLKIQ